MALLDRLPDSSALSRTRIFGAAWTTVILHLAIAVAVMIGVRRAERTQVRSAPLKTPLADLVWLERPGDTGLGGNGGHQQTGRPQSAQRPGTARLTMPARTPPSVGSDTARTPPLQEISVPVLPTAAGLVEIPGVVTTSAILDHGTSQGPGAGPGAGNTGRGPGLGDGDRGGVQDGRGGNGSGLRPPELLVQVRPQYTSAAMMARIEGVVGMEAVVMADGSVGEVRIVRSLDRNLGLDEQAVKAVKLWRFRPATRLGAAIPMFVSIEMTFSLR